MKQRIHISVEIKTALLKGYAHSGMILKADKLFESMCNGASKRDLPNTRSLNTLLRGCLWSAARPTNNECVVGGVMTAEKAWNRCKELQDQGRLQSIFDVSSFEYMITLLCQALRTLDAVSRINDLKKLFLTDDDINNTDPSLAETLSISYLSLARAYCILNERERVVDASDSSLKFLNVALQALARGQVPRDGQDGSDRRRESNQIFRTHRLNEVDRETRAIRELFKDGSSTSLEPRQTARRLMTRLLVLSGGGTTPDSSLIASAASEKSHDGDDLLTQIVNTAYFSYGFDTLTKKMNVKMREGVKILKRKDCNRLLGCIGLQGGVVRSDGSIDFHRIFSAGIGERKSRKGKKKKPKRMEIELGAGFGDWIVKKAMGNTDTNFVSVELRSDRVGQTFARTAALAGVAAVDNLCIVGAESCSFLSRHVQPKSVSTIFINHPEPPTQTSGLDAETIKFISEGGREPSHMLNSTMIIAAGRSLSEDSDSRIVIVTDNRWYGRLICATMVKVCLNCDGLLAPVDISKQDSSFELIETFTNQNSKSNANISVGLFQGQPNESIGHPKAEPASDKSPGASYFDRLWRSGGGNHAEKYLRFAIVMARDS